MTGPGGGASELANRLSDEPLLAFVVAAVVVLLVMVSVSVAWLTGRALWEHRIERLHRRFWHELGEPLASVLGDPEAEARWLTVARGHPAHVLRFCLNEYLIRTTGEYKEGLARLYRALGLLEFDLVGLRSRRWSVRVRALRQLAGVVTSEQRAAVAALASEPGEVRLLVAQIIGRIGTAGDVLPLLSSWPISSRLSEYPVHVMVNALSPDSLRELLKHWATLGSTTIQRILLDAAAKAVPGACHDFLPRAAAHASLEVRIAATHACGAITGAQTFALLGPLTKDDAWEVRAQAVKALGAHRSDAAVSLLITALSDKSFWVRQNAAASLGRHGNGGVTQLREVIASSTDRYARDAAEHVLTDLGMLERAEAS